MSAVENDRTRAGNIADGPSDSIDKDTFNDPDTGEVDDRLHIYGRLLTGKRQEPSRPIASELVTHIAFLWRHPDLTL